MVINEIRHTHTHVHAKPLNAHNYKLFKALLSTTQQPKQYRKPGKSRIRVTMDKVPGKTSWDTNFLRSPRGIAVSNRQTIHLVYLRSLFGLQKPKSMQHALLRESRWEMIH